MGISFDVMKQPSNLKAMKSFSMLCTCSKTESVLYYFHETMSLEAFPLNNTQNIPS